MEYFYFVQTTSAFPSAGILLLLLLLVVVVVVVIVVVVVVVVYLQYFNIIANILEQEYIENEGMKYYPRRI
jgi:hypothetical protein